MNQFFNGLGNLLQRYTLGQRMVLMVVFIGIVSVSISLVLWSNRPEMDVMYSDLDPSNAGKIVTELRGMKIDFELSDNGRTIHVPSTDVAELRIKFADMGLAASSISGYEIFDENKIGMTSFMQKLNLRRAMEGELVKTINQFPGVQNSRVHLVMPENQLFAKEKKGSASVVLHLNQGLYMGDDKVKGITALVANSVEGLDAENVVVVNSDGKLLSDNQGQDAILGSTGTQWDMRYAVESNLQRKVSDILEGIVGFQNSVVKVTVDLNFEKIERTIESFDPDNVSIISEERHSGSSSNVDSSDNRNISQESEDVITNYELNKTVEHFVGNTGTINQLAVAVLVNGLTQFYKDIAGNDSTVYTPKSQEELDQISALVKSAVGFKVDRGDVVEVQNIKFDNSSFAADKEYFKEAEQKELYSSLIDKGIIGIGLLLAFFLMRMLLKSSSDILKLPGITTTPLTQGQALEEGGPMPALESGGATAEVSGFKNKFAGISGEEFMRKLTPEAQAKLAATEKMTQEVITHSSEHPEDAARLIRSWLTKPVTPIQIPNPEQVGEQVESYDQ